jgi:hypothetical protein
MRTVVRTEWTLTKVIRPVTHMLIPKLIAELGDIRVANVELFPYVLKCSACVALTRLRSRDLSSSARSGPITSGQKQRQTRSL